MKFLFVTTAVCISSIAFAQISIKNIQLLKGQEFEQRSEMQMTISQEMMGQKIEIKTTTNTSSLINIQEATLTNYILSNTLKRMVFNMTGMGQDIAFDSDNAADMEGELGSRFKDKIGKPSLITADKNGVVSKIEGSDERNENDDIMNAVGEKIGQRLTMLLPITMVKVGQTWTDTTSTEDTKSFNTYTVKAINGNEGIVVMKSTTDLNKEMEREGMAVKVQMKANTEGEYMVDVTSGVIKTAKMIQKSKGTTEMMGQVIPMTMEMVVTTKVDKK